MSKFQVVQTLQSLKFEALSFIKQVPSTHQWKRSSTLNTKQRSDKLESHPIPKGSNCKYYRKTQPGKTLDWLTNLITLYESFQIKLSLSHSNILIKKLTRKTSSSIKVDVVQVVKNEPTVHSSLVYTPNKVKRTITYRGLGWWWHTQWCCYSNSWQGHSPMQLGIKMMGGDWRKRKEHDLLRLYQWKKEKKFSLHFERMINFLAPLMAL